MKTMKDRKEVRKLRSKEIIGAKVREIRKRMGLSQEKFAEPIKLSSRTVSNIETGKFLLKTETLCAIAEAYHVSTDEILGIDFK